MRELPPSVGFGTRHEVLVEREGEEICKTSCSSISKKSTKSPTYPLHLLFPRPLAAAPRSPPFIADDENRLDTSPVRALAS